MRIRDLSLPATDPAALAAYFADVLQMDVDGGAIVIGWSTIHPVPADSPSTGRVHLAFTVPDNRFAEAMAWLRERSPLQRSPDGKEYFALESNWKSQSVYFTGPDGLILELIGRKRLPHSSHTGPFHGSEITCLSEVGLPVDEVPDTQCRLADAFGLTPLSQPSDAFAPMGDDEGLLIVVDATRRWFPEQRDLPTAVGIEVAIEAAQRGGKVADAQQRWRCISL